MLTKTKVSRSVLRSSIVFAGILLGRELGPTGRLGQLRRRWSSKRANAAAVMATAAAGAHAGDEVVRVGHPRAAADDDWATSSLTRCGLIGSGHNL